jgi:ATP-binding cassette subfamily F protein 3
MVLGIIAQPSWAPAHLPIVRRYNAPDDPMSLLTASDLSKAFGAQDVFRGVSLTIAHQTRIALVGPNGVGKSTLLALLAGREQPDGGRIQRARSLRIGFLPQDGADAAGRLRDEQTVWDFCLEAFKDLRQQEQLLARLEADMADPRRTEQALSTYGPLQETFEQAGGYAYVGRTRQVLRGLGLEAGLWDRALSRLSGGERTRLSLARLLLEDPDLLLLDEPTNHLDLEALDWLESWLGDWPGAALVVSHDRFFLDRTVATVWELTADGIEDYPGNYSAYLRQRAERRLTQTRLHQAQQERARREREYIRRNLAGQNTRQAKGRRKRLERWIEQEAVDRPAEISGPKVTLAPSPRTGEKVLATEALVIAHPTHGAALFSVPNLTLDRGEVVAVLGPNGAGKTSLLRTLLGQTQPWGGAIRLGPSVRAGYLAQTESELDPDDRVLDSLLRAAPAMKPGPGRTWLARFGLAEDAEKSVGQLSGGERRRLALARLSLAGANLLLLDEPTNNLDLWAQEALQATLAEFPETVLLVTHDRYLAQALATQVWAISPGDRSMEVFRGSLSDYFEAKAARRAPRIPRQRPPGPPASRRNERGDKELAELESQVEAAEQALAALAKELYSAGADATAVTRLGLEYARREQELEGLLEAWAQAAERGQPA